MPNLALPPPREPLVLPDRTISRTWWRALQTLFGTVEETIVTLDTGLSLSLVPIDPAPRPDEAELGALALMRVDDVPPLADQVVMLAMMLAPTSESTVIMSGGNIVPPGAIMLISPVFAMDIDTAPGPQAFTLPASPEDGEQWRVKDATGHAQANHITVDAGGVSIDGGTTAILNQNYMARTFRWSPAYTKWIIE